MSYCNKIVKSNNILDGARRRTSLEMNIFWKAPPVRVVKVNIDGAFYSFTKLGCAGGSICGSDGH